MINLHELFRTESAAVLSLYGGSAPGCWRRELRQRARLDALRLASGWVEGLAELKIELFDGNLWGETLPQLVARSAPVGGAAGAFQSRAGHAHAPRTNPSVLPRRTPRYNTHTPPDADFMTSRDSDAPREPRERTRRSFVEATRARRGHVNAPRAHVDVGVTRPSIPGMPSAQALGGAASLPRGAPPDTRRPRVVSDLLSESRGMATPDACGLDHNASVAPALGGNVSSMSDGLRAEGRAGTAAGQPERDDDEARPTLDGKYPPRSSLDVRELPLTADLALLSQLQRPTRLQRPHETLGSLPHETKGLPVYASTHHGAAAFEGDASRRTSSSATPLEAAGRRPGHLAEIEDSARRFTHAPGAQSNAPLRRLRSVHAESRADVVAVGAWLDEMFARVARAMWRPGEGIGAPRMHDPAAVSRQRSLSLRGPEATRDLLLRVTAQAAPDAVGQGVSRGATSQSTQPGAAAERWEADRVDVAEGRRPVPRDGSSLLRGTTPAAVVNDEPVNAPFEPHVSTFEVAPLLTLPPFLSDELPRLPARLGDEPQEPPEAEDLDALAEKIKLIIDEQARRHGIDV